MDAVAIRELVPSLALAIGLAACAGLHAWLPLLLTGLLARFEYLELGPPSSSSSPIARSSCSAPRR